MNKFKLHIIGWLLAFFWLASFCNATSYEDQIQLVKTWHLMYHTGWNTANVINLYDLGGASDTYYWTFCIMFYNATSSSTSNSNTIKIGGAGWSTSTINNTYMYYTDQQNNRVCLYVNKRYFNVQWSTSSSWYFEWDYKIFKLNTFLDNQIPTYKLYIADLSSGFNEYTINDDINLTYDSSDIDLYRSSDFSFEFWVNSNNRISKSSVNQNYCTSNNLCPSCPSCNNYTIKLYDVSNEENPTLEYSGTIENNRNIYYSGVNVDQWLLGTTKSFTFYDTNTTCTGNTMSSLECQTEYWLIPINEITSNYCKINFDLIDPTECPWNNTGDIIFSNLYINNTRYQWASNIFLRINDSLLYTYNYSGWQITIDVDYDVDPDYIEDIINKERLTPTNQDFENLITWMQYYIPYIMIALLLWRAVFVFKKVFKF